MPSRRPSVLLATLPDLSHPALSRCQMRSMLLLGVSLGLGNTIATGLRLRTLDLPPWKRQRALPGSALTWQQPPARVLAPQRRRPLRRLGDVWSHADITVQSPTKTP